MGTEWTNKTALAKEYIAIYKRFGAAEKDWNKLIEVVAQATFRDVAQGFQAFDFFNQRQTVSDGFAAGLKTALKTFGFDVTQVLLLNIKVPSAFDSSI